MSSSKVAGAFLLLALLFFVPNGYAEDAIIHALTFNIRYGSARDEGHAWDSRKDAVVEVIRETKADFVGLQESLSFQNDFLRAELGSTYVLVGEGREGGNRGEYATLLYDSSKYTLVRAGRFWLSDTPEAAGSKSWSSLPRIVNWIEVLSNATSSRYLILNTHFSHESEEARDRSARLIRDRLPAMANDEETVVILMGDFNAPPGSPPHRTLTDPAVGFLDAQVQSGSAERRTFNGFRETLETDGRPIDWILYRGPIEVTSYRVLEERVGDVLPSDHYPVLATFRVENSR